MADLYLMLIYDFVAYGAFVAGIILVRPAHGWSLVVMYVGSFLLGYLAVRLALRVPWLRKDHESLPTEGGIFADKRLSFADLATTHLLIAIVALPRIVY